MTHNPDKNRRLPILHKSSVKEVLPEHFYESYPNLITFLDKYYQFLDSDQTYSFDQDIKSLITVRDLEETSLANLDKLLKEIGLNIASANFYNDPRSAARLLAKFFRVKGSLYSSEAFFKAFYGIDPVIEYPKRNIFIVGQSQIGAESLQYLQDGALYQIFSILIKSELPIAQWLDLYKQFVHPAGFYIGSEVTFTTVANFTTAFDTMPTVFADSNAGTVTYTLTANQLVTGTDEITELVGADSAGVFYRQSVTKTVADYATIPISQLDAMYQSIITVASTNSFTFDEDSDLGGRTMDLSNSIETFDQVVYPWYDSDSA